MSRERVTLRPYQKQAIAEVLSARRRGTRRVVVCLPTGAGKTVIFAELARMARQPVLVLAHREELLTQAADKLQRAVGAHKNVTLEQGPHRASDEAHVVVSSLRSLHPKRLQRLMRQYRFGLVLYDECHHAVAEDNRRVLKQLGCFQDSWAGTLVGFTATPNRADGVGLDEVFEAIVYEQSLREMLLGGWLVPLRGFRLSTGEDLRELSGAQDFDETQLAEAIDVTQRNNLVARAILELARDRRTVAFCVTVKHARNLCRALNQIGLPAGLVHGAMDKQARRRELSLFRRGHLQVLTNVGVLTEGFDDPGVSCIAMARPTRSEALYAQCVGRGTRLAPEKTDCLVLDFVDLSDLSLVTLPSLFGMPRDLDLRGQDLVEAVRRWQDIEQEALELDLEPGAITLDEIKRRAESFDPLTRRVDPAVSAVSDLAWQSLGARGLALHLIDRRDQLLEVLIVRAGAGRRPWVVRFNGRDMAQMGSLQQAVEATEYELERKGPQVRASGLDGAAWRRAPAPPELLEVAQMATKGRAVNTVAEALAAITYLEQLRARAAPKES